MKDGEKNKRKGTKIYCIYFENEEYRCNSDEDPKIILQQICELGGTETYKYAKDLPTLLGAFTEISNAIETNFKLEYYKNQNENNELI